MKGPADSPTISLTNENFRAAETWEYAVDAPASAITAGVLLVIPPIYLGIGLDLCCSPSWLQVTLFLTTPDAACLCRLPVTLSVCGIEEPCRLSQSEMHG